MNQVCENLGIIGGPGRSNFYPGHFNLKGASFQIMPELEYLTVDHLTLRQIAHIFSQIDIDPVTGCWNWMGPLRDGYGLRKHDGRSEEIHRLLYAWTVEPLPRGFQARRFAQLDHLCKNRRCCNPPHLEVVSQRENVLRGSSPPAINVLKTHCPKGHLLKTPASGQRYCPECDMQKHRNRMAGPNRDYWLEKARINAKRYYWKKRGMTFPDA